MKIIWSPLAIDRASEIAEYIALNKPSAEADWINTVFSKVKQLKYSPETGRFCQLMNFWHNLTIHKDSQRTGRLGFGIFLC